MEFKPVLLVAVCAASIGVAQSESSVQLKSPQSRPAGFAEVHAQQALGRVIVSADGRHILYEWGRPYLDWVPEFGWIAPNAARRLETFIYKVDLTRDDPTSEYLFYPNAGATYWLGDLSPDGAKVALFELSHDTKNVRAGVWDLEENRRVWFGPRVDEGKLKDATVWISNEEFLYPGKERGRLIRANATTGDAQICRECSDRTIETAELSMRAAAMQAKQHAAKIADAALPAGLFLVAGSGSGDVAVYVKDDKDVLSLMYQRSGEPMHVLFENKRSWQQQGTAARDAPSKQ